MRRFLAAEEQVDELDLPNEPGKATTAVQAEAIAPDDLARIVREAVEGVLDLDAVARVQAQAEQEREDLVSRVAGLAGG